MKTTGNNQADLEH